MKMKKIFVFSLGLAGLLFASCNKEIVPATPADGAQVVTISASTADVDTKLSSSTKGKFTWTTGDVIGVWTGSELTPFTLDKSYNGLGYGKFTGTIPAGGAITADSYAVYPYEGMTATATEVQLPSLNAGWGCNYPTRSYFLFSNKANLNDDGTVSGFSFSHQTAYFRVTLKNIAVSAKAIFYENYCPNKSVSYPGYMLAGGKITTATGELTPEANDWAFIPLPEHTAVIESLTLILPIIPGAFGDSAKFRLCACTAATFGNEMEGCNFQGFLTLNPSAGDYYVFPDITFPNEKSADDTGSGVNDGIEDSVVNEQDANFWKVG